MSSSSKTTALQLQFTQDDTKSFFQVIHRRGQRNVKHERLLTPLSNVSGDVSGQEIAFKLAKVGHHVNTLYLRFIVDFTAAEITKFCAHGDNQFALVDLWGMRLIERVEIDYGGDNIMRISDDEMRVHHHLYRSDSEKQAHRAMASGFLFQKTISEMIVEATGAVFVTGGKSSASLLQPAGWNTEQARYGKFTFGRTSDVYSYNAVTGADKLTVPVQVEIPWTHEMSSDRNLPIALLDSEPTIRIKFRSMTRVLFSAHLDAGTPLTLDYTGGTISQPRLLVEYRDQPGPLINALSKEPSITYPLSHVVKQRFELSAITDAPTVLELSQLRGLVHTMVILIRKKTDVDGLPVTSGKTRASSGVKISHTYDYDALDFGDATGVVGTANTAPMPSGQRMLESFSVSANGELITGKTPMDATYNLTQYKSKYFPGHTELLAQSTQDATYHSVNPRGYNAYVYTWGLDGAREAVGTGNINMDALSAVSLTLNWRKDNNVAKDLARFNKDTGNTHYYIDVMCFTANFTTISGGNWFRQLA